MTPQPGNQQPAIFDLNLRTVLPFRFQVPASMFPHRVDVVRTINDFDDAGGQVAVDNVIATQVRCFVQPTTPQERMMFQRYEEEITHTVLMPTNPGIIDGDCLIFSGRRLVAKGVDNAMEANVGWIIPAHEIVQDPLP